MKSFHKDFDFDVRIGCKRKSLAQITIRSILLILISWSLAYQTFSAGIDWRLMKDVSLNEPPIDVVASFDGSFIFILTTKAVLVYARSIDKIVNRIPVNNAFDKLTYSGAKNELILTGTNSKAMVDRDLREGRQLGINATPTVFINGKYLERISLGDISEMIAAELL